MFKNSNHSPLASNNTTTIYYDMKKLPGDKLTLLGI